MNKPAAAETQDVLTTGTGPRVNREVLIDALVVDAWCELDRGLAILEQELAGGPAVVAMELRDLAQQLRIAIEGRRGGRVVHVQSGSPDDETLVGSPASLSGVGR